MWQVFLHGKWIKGYLEIRVSSSKMWILFYNHFLHQFFTPIFYTKFVLHQFFLSISILLHLVFLHKNFWFVYTNFLLHQKFCFLLTLIFYYTKNMGKSSRRRARHCISKKIVSIFAKFFSELIQNLI